jgi:hypothetical protein
VVPQTTTARFRAERAEPHEQQRRATSLTSTRIKRGLSPPAGVLGWATVRGVRSFVVTDEVRDYAVDHGSWRPDEVVRRLRSETAALGEVAGMQIGDDQGQLLTMLTG